MAAQQVFEQGRRLAAIARGRVAGVAPGNRGVRGRPFAWLPGDRHVARLADYPGVYLLWYTRHCKGTMCHDQYRSNNHLL